MFENFAVGNCPVPPSVVAALDRIRAARVHTKTYTLAQAHAIASLISGTFIL